MKAIPLLFGDILTFYMFFVTWFI